MALVSKDKVQTFAGTAEKSDQADDAYCTVLFGYGKEPKEKIWWVDNYKCEGGVIRNVLKADAERWAKGIRTDGKPAVGRIYLQAILPKNATEADFIAATGANRVSTEQLAASISATDAKNLLEALGVDEAARLSRELAQAVATFKK